MDLLRVFGEVQPLLTKGLWITVEVTVLSLLLALVIGLISCFLALSKRAPLRWISKVYVGLVRGTPLLVQVFYIYFAIPQLLQLMGFDVRFTPFIAGLITLTLNAGAYLSEIFRGAINAVNPGLMEAARSLGLSYGAAMRKVILPQAVRIMVPSLVNQCIITLKDSSILSVIGLTELTQTGRLIIANNFESFKMWIIVAIMYFIPIMILTKLSQWVERKLKIAKN